MIEIYAGNTLIPVFPSSRISFRALSPVLSRSVKPGLRNLPFRGPLTAEVIRLFGLQSHLHQSAVPAGIACSVRVHGNTFFAGELHLLSSDTLSAEYVITDLTRDFYTEFGEKKMSELPFPSENVPRSTISKMVFEFLTATNGKEHNFIVNGENHKYTATASDTPITLADKFATDINANFPGYANANGPVLTIEQPSINDPYLVGWTAPYGGADYIVTSQMTMAEARWIDWSAHINNVINNPGNYDYTFPMTNNPGLYEDKNPPWALWVNPYDNGVLRNQTYNGVKEWEHAYVPYWRVKYILLQIFEIAGYELIDSPLLTLFNDLVIYNATPIDDIQQEWMQGPQVFGYTNSYSLTINPSNHVGDITVKDFLRSIELTFNFIFDFDRKEKKVSIRPLKSLVSSRPGKSVEHLLAGRPKTILPERNTILLRHKQQDNDYFSISDITWQEYEYPMGAEKETIQSALGVVYSTVSVSSPAGNATYPRVPIVDHPGNSAILQLKNNVVPRLLWYRGLYPDSLGNNYPYAAYDDLDPSETHISGAVSLRWDGSYGLIAQYWDDWLEFLKNYRIIELRLIPARFRPDDLDFFSTLRAFDSLFLLESYTLRLPEGRPMPVRLLRL